MGNCFCWRIIDALFTHKEGEVMEQLPQELIIEVLKLLPVKSLLRFRCLSKSLCDIIDSPYFINSHLNRSSEDRSHLNLIFPYREQILTDHNLVKLSVSDFNITPYGLAVFGYCNGVFLLLVHSSKLGLWNPSTHQSRIIDCSPGFLPEGVSLYSLCDGKIRTGLGYDSSQDDYKVVVIKPLAVQYQPEAVENQVWVFGLKSNSWRRVHTDLPALANTFSWPFDSIFGYFAHGDLHWLFSNETKHGLENYIVSFDMGKETFSILTQPAYFPKKATDINLNVLDGCLCIGFRSFIFKDEALLYIRKKDGTEFAWSLLYSVTIDQLPPFLKGCFSPHVEVLGYSKEADKVVLDLGLKYMVSYDLKDKSFQPTEITRPINEFYYHTRSFVESLVSV